MKSNTARFLCRRMNLLSHSESSHLKDHCRINYFMSLLTEGNLGRTFSAFLLALLVAIIPLVDLAHDINSHTWSITPEPGFCEADCDVSEHKLTNLHHDCSHVRIRDYTPVELGSNSFFESVETFSDQLAVTARKETLLSRPPSRSPPLT